MPLASRHRTVRAGGRHASNLIYTSVLGVNASKKTGLDKFRGYVVEGDLREEKCPPFTGGLIICPDCSPCSGLSRSSSLINPYYHWNCARNDSRYYPYLPADPTYGRPLSGYCRADLIHNRSG